MSILEQKVKDLQEQLKRQQKANNRIKQLEAEKVELLDWVEKQSDLFEDRKQEANIMSTKSFYAGSVYAFKKTTAFIETNYAPTFDLNTAQLMLSINEHLPSEHRIRHTSSYRALDKQMNDFLNNKK